jgi:hypothetical protein
MLLLFGNKSNVYRLFNQAVKQKLFYKNYEGDPYYFISLWVVKFELYLNCYLLRWVIEETSKGVSKWLLQSFGINVYMYPEQNTYLMPDFKHKKCFLFLNLSMRGNLATQKGSHLSTQLYNKHFLDGFT